MFPSSLPNKNQWQKYCTFLVKIHLCNITSHIVCRTRRPSRPQHPVFCHKAVAESAQPLRVSSAIENSSDLSYRKCNLGGKISFPAYLSLSSTYLCVFLSHRLSVHLPCDSVITCLWAVIPHSVYVWVGRPEFDSLQGMSRLSRTALETTQPSIPCVPGVKWTGREAFLSRFRAVRQNNMVMGLVGPAVFSD
jgi:hypothetical protein